MSDNPIAVIDIGSNSGRLLVARLVHGHHLDVLADASAPLRLVRDLDSREMLSGAALDRTVAACGDFLSIAHSAGCRETVAVATAAVRRAANREVLLDRLWRELRLRVEIIDGDREGEMSLLGAIQGLPASDGWLVDIGGGSVELRHVRNRLPEDGCSLPFGALAATDAFLPGDPPRPADIRRLRDAMNAALDGAGISPLRAGEVVIGTGGTIRNLAKMDRAGHARSVPRLHGLAVERAAIHEWSRQLPELPLARRQGVPGLSRDRADSIVAGAVVLDSIMEWLRASHVMVSGQGLREGVLLRHLGRRASDRGAVREASVRALCARFSSWRPERAGRRVEVLGSLLDLLDPGVDVATRQRGLWAAALLDIGRSVDHYDRAQHAAHIVVHADLQGFAHDELAEMALVLERCRPTGPVARHWGDLLPPGRRRGAERMGALLALSDEIEQRLPPRRHPHLRLRTVRRRLRLEVDPGVSGVAPGVLRRLARVLGHEIDVAASS